MEDGKLICSRVEALRAWMHEKGLSAFIVPSGDPHMSEYPPARWQSRAWISGFDGSAGTAVVTATAAALWTDSRYFLAAAGQLEGTPFQLMKDGLPDTPGIAEWLASQLHEGDVVGVDGAMISPDVRSGMSSSLAASGIGLSLAGDPFAVIWQDRPAAPSAPVEIHPLEYAGESCRSKIARLLSEADAQGCDAMLLTALDDIAWTLNLRGSDVECNPVFVSYLLLSRSRSLLFIDLAKVPAAVSEYLAGEGVEVMPYDRLTIEVSRFGARRTLLPDDVNCAVEALFVGKTRQLAPSVAARLKAVKNEAEIAGFHAAMLRDGVAMVEFLSRLDGEVARGITEMGVDRLLTSMRSRQPLYRDLSFPTIAAYGPHGAIVHYEADRDSDVRLEPRGFILIDSGAQYRDGTTDITRTIPLGPLTDEERRVYTLVLKGHIALSRLCFPDGASGTQLDCAARAPMWQQLMNYGHGTGHGVGSYLNVHEGPHQIRMNYMPAPLRAGMTVTDEPGLYLAGRFGVRIENTLLITAAGESEFGRFLKFEPLTLCPIATSPIDFSLLTADEAAWIDGYHATVRSRLMPLIADEGVRNWLSAATQPVSRG